jgi:hypothetical protein
MYDTKPGDYATANMAQLKTRILAYANSHGRLPATLAELIESKEHKFLLVDDWRREIQYRHDEAGVVTLYSLGADGRLGGEGGNRDIVGVFETRDDHGQVKQTAGWKIRPHR